MTPFVSALLAALRGRADPEPDPLARHIIDPVGPRPCWHCGAPTRYVEVNFEAPLCPGACTDEKDAAYWVALAESFRRDPRDDW